jgi:hypothetical protein
MNLSAVTKECARRFNDVIAGLQKQAPSAKMVGKFAVDQAVREARKVVVRPSSKDDATSD